METSGAAGVPQDMAEALAARVGRLGAFASRVIYFHSTGSTNDVADRLAADGADHGTVVVADAQESGRGRLGRSWFSPPGAGLYVSVVLRPDTGHVGSEAGGGRREAVTPPPSALRLPPVRPQGVAFASAVSLTAGVALAEGIRAASGLDVWIKWPNDLVVDRRKLCGILAEASSRAGAVQHVVLGYGINVRPAAYPPDISQRATSLETELGREVDRAAVLAETLASLARWLPVAATSFDLMLQRWRTLSPSSVGSPVEVMRPGGEWAPASTAGVDEDGALMVMIGGALERVIAGEVRWR